LPSHGTLGWQNDGGTMTDTAGKDRIRMTVGEARALGEASMRGAG
jgi:hypothetical protein